MQGPDGGTVSAGLLLSADVRRCWREASVLVLPVLKLRRGWCAVGYTWPKCMSYTTLNGTVLYLGRCGQSIGCAL